MEEPFVSSLLLIGHGLDAFGRSMKTVSTKLPLAKASLHFPVFLIENVGYHGFYEIHLVN